MSSMNYKQFTNFPGLNNFLKILCNPITEE